MMALSATAQNIYRQILEIQRRGDEPACVRVGLLEYYELAHESRLLEGPLQPSLGPSGRILHEVFGVPLARVGLDHHLAVWPRRRPGDRWLL